MVGAGGHVCLPPSNALGRRPVLRHHLVLVALPIAPRIHTGAPNFPLDSQPYLSHFVSPKVGWPSRLQHQWGHPAPEPVAPWSGASGIQGLLGDSER